MKKSDIGRAYFLREAGSSIAIVGDEGIAWMDTEGDIERTVNVKNARGFQLDNNNAIMFDNRTAYLISLDSKVVREIENGSPMIGDNILLYSPEAKCLLRVTGGRVYGYNF